jgi:predicted transcriptional regulator
MAVTKKIIDLLAQETKLNANQIIEKIGEKETSVKTTLCMLTKKGKVVREKVVSQEPVRVGPKNVYFYSLPT